MKKKVFWLILAVIVVVIIAVILLSKYKKKKAIAILTAAASPQTTTTTTTTGKIVTSSVFPLKVGSESNEVLNLQKYLNYMLKYKYPTLNKINENGAFGSDTLRMLKLILNVETMSQSLYNTSVYPWVLNNK